MIGSDLSTPVGIGHPSWLDLSTNNVHNIGGYYDKAHVKNDAGAI